MTSSEILLLLVAVGATLVGIQAVRRRYWHEFIVQDGFVGLLYNQGKLVESLAPGRYTRWGRHYRLAQIDTRKTLLPVNGQEVLTSDNVSVKVSAVLVAQIIDAPLAVRSADNHIAHLYSATQTAIRNAVAAMSMDELLSKRLEIGVKLRELLVPEAETCGVRLHTAEIRDVMLPGEIRKAFSDVLKAKQEGLAALERARGESAALRNLSNAARLIEGQPALATLRFLQTLSATGTNQTLVLNDLSALLPNLKRGAREVIPPTESG